MTPPRPTIYKLAQLTIQQGDQIRAIGFEIDTTPKATRTVELMIVKLSLQDIVAHIEQSLAELLEDRP